MEVLGIIGGILAIIVSLGTLAGFYISRLKDAEKRGAERQEMKEMKYRLEATEVKIVTLESSHVELSKDFIEQKLLLAQMMDKIDEIALNLKELVKEHNCRRMEGLE